MFESIARAQASTQAAAPASPGFGEMLLPFALIMFVFYFIYARPQQKKLREHQSMLGQLKRGDSVITSGGIFGQVTGITEKFVTLEVADNVRIRVLRTQISSLAKEGAP